MIFQKLFPKIDRNSSKFYFIRIVTKKKRYQTSSNIEKNQSFEQRSTVIKIISFQILKIRSSLRRPLKDLFAFILARWRSNHLKSTHIIHQKRSLAWFDLLISPGGSVQRTRGQTLTLAGSKHIPRGQRVLFIKERSR